uniref:Uncharacterized protein n=1 Tax=Moniliophthora roreri TaxID=221103 RepID=A0A0W0G4H2_MONRR
MPPRTQTQDPAQQSVWDDKDLIEASLNKQSSTPNKERDMTDKVYEYLCALLAQKYDPEHTRPVDYDSYGGDFNTDLYGDGEQ